MVFKQFDITGEWSSFYPWITSQLKIIQEGNIIEYREAVNLLLFRHYPSKIVYKCTISWRHRWIFCQKKNCEKVPPLFFTSRSWRVSRFALLGKIGNHLHKKVRLTPRKLYIARFCKRRGTLFKSLHSWLAVEVCKLAVEVFSPYRK